MFDSGDKICMTRTRNIFKFIIIGRNFITVPGHQSNWSSCCYSVENTTDYFRKIRFLSFGCPKASTLPSLKIRYKIICFNVNTGRTSVNNHANGLTMRFPEHTDSENNTKRIHNSTFYLCIFYKNRAPPLQEFFQQVLYLFPV